MHPSQKSKVPVTMNEVEQGNSENIDNLLWVEGKNTTAKRLGEGAMRGGCH